MGVSSEMLHEALGQLAKKFKDELSMNDVEVNCDEDLTQLIQVWSKLVTKVKVDPVLTKFKLDKSGGKDAKLKRLLKYILGQ